MPVRDATPEDIDEMNRIRGEGWTVFIPSPVRPKTTTKPSRQPPTDGEAKPEPDGDET
jgi:hypothetical protein